MNPDAKKCVLIDENGEKESDFVPCDKAASKDISKDIPKDLDLFTSPSADVNKDVQTLFPENSEMNSEVNPEMNAEAKTEVNFEVEPEVNLEAETEVNPEDEAEDEAEANAEVNLEAEPEAEVKKLNRTAVMEHNSQEVNQSPQLNMSATNNVLDQAAAAINNTATDIKNGCDYDEAELKLNGLCKALSQLPIADPIARLFEAFGKIRVLEQKQFEDARKNMKNDHDQAISDLRRERDDLRKERDDLRKERDDLRNAADRYNEEMAKANAYIAQIQSEFKGCNDQLIQAQTVIKQYEEQMPMMGSQITSQAEMIKALNMQIAATQTAPVTAIRPSGITQTAPVTAVHQPKPAPVDNLARLKAYNTEGQTLAFTPSPPQVHIPRLDLQQPVQATHTSRQFFQEPTPVAQTAVAPKVSPIANIDFDQMKAEQIRPIIEKHFPGKYTEEMEGTTRIGLFRLINEINRNFGSQ